MRVLWTHNFDPAVPNAGIFMEIAAQAMERAGVEIECQYLGNLRTPKGLLQARRLVHDLSEDFDIVHAQFGSACALASLKASRPLVISMRGSDWVPAYSPKLRWKAHGWAATWMSRRSLPACAVVVSVSHRIADQIRAVAPSTPVEVLPDPIDLDHFLPGSRVDARRHLGLPDDRRRYVLFTAVNRDASNKRFALAEASVAHARKQLPNVELLVGTGYHHDEMPLVVAASDVVLCTSTAEGWPNSVKEALACNLPFVSTDVSDLQAIAEVEPSCHVVEPYPTILGDALVETLSGPAPRGLRQHVFPMSTKAFAAELLAVYRRVLP